jgi:broad specificity phosphatase PhoE
VSKRLLLVRHARPTANWNDHPDSELDPTGLEQAAALAADLGPTGPRPLVSSPLLRTRETAAPLAKRWGIEPEIRSDVGEIPSPDGEVADRGAWLRDVLRGSWADVDAPITRWREELLAALLAFDDATVVVTHFVAINAAVGYATGSDRIITFRPDHCSRTELAVDGERLSLVALGHERITEVR